MVVDCGRCSDLAVTLGAIDLARHLHLAVPAHIRLARHCLEIAKESSSVNCADSKLLALPPRFHIGSIIQDGDAGVDVPGI